MWSGTIQAKVFRQQFSIIGFRNIKILNSYIITDAARFENQGWIYRPMINLFCLTLYFLGFNINNICTFYFWMFKKRTRINEYCSALFRSE